MQRRRRLRRPLAELIGFAERGGEFAGCGAVETGVPIVDRDEEVDAGILGVGGRFTAGT
jgi:hypothetical protein